MNIEEAKKLAVNQRPWLSVQKATEFNNYFVIVLGLKNSKEPYIGGATRVDKKTGKCSLYNPLLED